MKSCSDIIYFLDQEAKLLYYLTAVGAKRCSPETNNCTDGCKHDGAFEGIPPQPVSICPRFPVIAHALCSSSVLTIRKYILEQHSSLFCCIW